MEEGGLYLNTEFNAGGGSLYNELINGATLENPVDIYICGEALSHCVNYSLRHLVEKLKADTKEHVNVHLVLNCSSTVVLPGPKFFGSSVKLIDDILIKYKDYCDIVFWDGRALISSEYIVKKTISVFAEMAGKDGLGKDGYVEKTYQEYLDSKHGLTVAFEAQNAQKLKAKGGKRTKKKRRSKTQKKRKGQIKKSKRHRRSRK